MPVCYVVGGLGESSLYAAPLARQLVWPDPATLLLGQVGKMRLAPNGTDPGPPDGIALIADGVPGPYVGFPVAQLQAQMALDGYSIRTFAWDWRQSIYPAGVALAALIRGAISAADPCAIVAHSAGGLVARAAWTELGNTGDQAKIRRIVTLGTPHWGSYNVPLFWMGSSETIDILEYWNGTVGLNSAGFAPSVTGYSRLTPAFYALLALSWPALYDVLPVLGAPDAADDPHRAALYDAANWPEALRPQQAWLDHAKNVTGPWLLSGASQPPADVLTCVYGYGDSAASQLVDPAQLGDPSSVGAYVAGDGTVTQSSAALATGTQYGYILGHADLFPGLVARGDVRSEILAVNPGPPPPPPVVSTAIPLPQVGPIPAAVLPAYTNRGSQACVGPSCPC